MMRVFLAVELSQGLRDAIASFQAEMRRRLQKELAEEARISWVQPASIHLTVKFLGDIDEQLVPPLCETVAQAVRRLQAVVVPVDRPGAFPRPQAPRVLWLGPSQEWERGDETRRLALIQQSIEQTCKEFGFPRETKPFNPHLTLARIKEGERPVGNALARSGLMDRPVTLGSVTVDSVVLMKSDLRPTGSVYTKLWEAKVGSGLGQI
ncbi:MAG TPA: RNA 2',3'-cyclic phosphodiesterase [Nitrospiraceae bacterium]|nr:RNA 2',3'-cyclic phosphodiesterase [Nitrospiraceae bacterium]